MKTIRGLWLLACLIAALGASGAAPAEKNLIRNGDFEEGAAGWSLPKTYRVAEGVAHGGKASLAVENKDPKAYLLATQALDFKAGQQYRFGAWIKTRGVRGNEGGASICIEWSGKKGWLGGSYARGIKGDRDWVYVEALTQPIPAEATSVHLSLYLRRGMTGEAWFDDVRAIEVYPPALDAALVWPNYRGRLAAESANQTALVRAKIGARLEGGLDPRQALLFLELLQGGKSLLKQSIMPNGMEYMDIPLWPASFPPGEYQLKVELVAPSGKTLGHKEFALTKLAPGAPAPTVYIDEHNRTLVDGKPFFPLGWYFGPGPTDKDYLKHLDRLAASPFNTIMCYGINVGNFDRVRAYLDAMAQRKLKIIYSIKDIYAGTEHYHEPILGLRGEETIVRKIVGTFKDHPALLAWYLNDELPLTLREQIDARQRLVRQLDPNHPTWSVLYQVDEFFGYLNSADVLGADPYPIPSKPAALAAEWTRKCAAVSGGRLPLWMVPQAFDWSNYPPHTDKGRPPTLDEELVMSYLCLIHGAQGLIYYSYSDLLKDREGEEKRWAIMQVVGGEMKQLFPALLSAAKPPQMDVKQDAGVETAVRADDSGKCYVLMANPGAKAASVRVAVPGGAKLELLRRGKIEPAAAAAGECVIKLDPLGAATLLITKK